MLDRILAKRIVAVALNTEKPERIRTNVASAHARIPHAFWQAMKDDALVAPCFPV